MGYVELRSFENQKEVNAVAALLKDAHIHYQLEDHQVDTDDPALHPVLCSTRLMIHPADLEKAWDVIDGAEHLFLRKISCPVCKEHALRLLNQKLKYRSKLAALACMILTGKSVETKKYYQCTFCGYDFKELPPD